MMNDTPSEKMDEIPDHAIQSPFGVGTPGRIKQTERFNKYRTYIVGWYRDIYNSHSISTRGFTCAVCDSYISSAKSGKILAHLASLKHLQAALGDKLEESDQRNKRRVVKHGIYSTPAVVETVIADVGSGLGE
jgi:hypothetical protein